MTLNEYQKETARTAAWDDLAILGLGLTGEAGEVADLLKKHLGHGHTLDVSAIKKELGDCLWYVARLAAALDITFDDVAVANIKKLHDRYPDGFSTADSIAKKDSK